MSDQEFLKWVIGLFSAFVAGCVVFLLYYTGHLGIVLVPILLTAVVVVVLRRPYPFSQLLKRIRRPDSGLLGSVQSEPLLNGTTSNNPSKTLEKPATDPPTEFELEPLREQNIKKRTWHWQKSSSGNSIHSVSDRDEINNPLIRLSSVAAKQFSSVENIKFFGQGTALDLGSGLLDEPLVYAIPGKLESLWDASLLELGLPIDFAKAAGFPALSVPSLPYWPTYRNATPEQRAVYRDWLIDGRKDPHIDPGYIFIYFYGLERRALVDRFDHPAIASELLRLLPIYRGCHSFVSYATALIWCSLWLSGGVGVTAELVRAAIKAIPSWDDELTAWVLAYCCQAELPISSRLAYHITKVDRRCSISVVCKRHANLFMDLFRKRYRQRFPDGIKLRSSKQPRLIVYRPASASLLRMEAQKTFEFRLLNPLGLSSQFKPLLEIWEQCVEELRVYDKASRKEGTDAISAVEYEALPADLRTGDHPEFGRWWEIKQKYSDADGWTVIPISELAAIKGIQRTTTFTKRECLQLLSTADATGFGIEPDFRLTGCKYRPEDKVAMFLLSSAAEEDQNGYVAASTLMSLGISIAAVDGKAQEGELTLITQQLKGQFNLAPDHATRLEHLRHLLITTGNNIEHVIRRLQRRLTPEQRKVIGAFLVGIAAADQIVTEQEYAALRRFYTLLNLPHTELQSLLSSKGARVDSDEPVTIQQGTAPVAGESILAQGAKPAGEVLTLDMAAISRIMAETREVASILRDAMKVSDDEIEDLTEREGLSSAGVATLEIPENNAIAVVDAPVHASVAQGLQPRFRQFFKLLVERSAWPRAELTALAREQNMMLDGAIEAINEWSQEQFGDWLIEEGDPVRIRTDLLKSGA